MRRKSRLIHVGAVDIGGTAPISVQSMCNTDTKDIISTVSQIHLLEQAGADIVRLAINSEEDAISLKKIKKEVSIPIIGDIQFDYKLALYAIKNQVDGLRINPGNIGAKWKIAEVVNACKDAGISIRTGVNSGSIKQEFLDKFHGVNSDSICFSALEQTELIESLGFSDIKVSLKSSDVKLSIESYRKFAELTDYPLHLGITEAGPSFNGTIKSSIGIGSLLLDGIGDTIRVSLTADPVEEIKVGREILKSIGELKDGVEIISCPTCARTKIDLIPLVNKAQERFSKLKINAKIAIMGCIVNGPGEAKEADYGITGGNGKGIIFKGDKIIKTVEESDLLDELIAIIERDKNE